MIKSVIHFYNGLDQRSNYLPLTSPIAPIAIIFCYLYFCLKCGKEWMENRKPFHLQSIVMAYNALQVIVNVTFVIYAISAIIYYLHPNFKFNCQEVDFTDSTIGTTEFHGIYYFYLIKYLDLCDTVLFVMRKKFRLITFLHLYHHAVMIFTIYLVLKIQPGGHMMVPGIINSIVHSFMYSYYFFTIYNPTSKWISKLKIHMTHLQLTQFAYLAVHFARAILTDKCNIPKSLLYYTFIANVTMSILFLQFYYKTYIVKWRKIS